jgi:hypothetical protein
MLITIRDESATGHVTNELTLDVLTESITVRELIRSRVYEEVQDHNLARRQAAGQFRGLVQPSATEQQLNGPKTIREIDWKKQFDIACDAFARNGFFILIDDKQAESLDETVVLKHDTKVSFVKLTPMVGG